jgi:hypothetical protein
VGAFAKYFRATESHFGRHQDFACWLERGGRKAWATHYRVKSAKLWAARHKALNMRLPAAPLEQ